MSKELISPKEIVANALMISVDQLNDHSAYGETVNWDSLNHVDIINALEHNYNIRIPDSEIEHYTTMKAINELYENLKQSK
jgi:acyl carrier protein